MRAIAAVARDQLADLYHRRLFVLVAVIAGLTTMAVPFAVHVLHDEKEAVNWAYAFCLTWLPFFALFAFCTAFSADLDRGTSRVVLSKPLARAQYVLGKVVGCELLLLAYLLFCVWAITVLSLAYRLDTAITLPMVVQAFLGSLVLGLYGMMLATLMHPLLAGLVAYMLRGHVIHYLLLGVPASKWYWPLLYLLHLLLPEDFAGLTRGVVEGPSALVVGAAPAIGLLGAGGYCVLLTLAAIFLLRRQDLVGSSRG